MSTTRVVAVSDLHGHLPEIRPCDLLLIAGDVCPLDDHSLDFQVAWLNNEFTRWLKSVPATCVASVWGNHDWAGMVVPQCMTRLPWINLVNQVTKFNGLTIYGSPWTRSFNDWAFNLPEAKLAQLHSRIPQCDILMTHGPALGIGDQYHHERLGCPALLDSIERIKPKVHVFGHVHSQHGMWTLNDHKTLSANVSLVNGQYYPVHSPLYFEM